MAELPVDLRTIVALKSWEDPKFASDLKKNPKKAVKRLAKTLGLDIGNAKLKIVDEDAEEYTLVIPENPMGASPAEMRKKNSEVTMLRGGGTINTFTADCGCGVNLYRRVPVWDCIWNSMSCLCNRNFVLELDVHNELDK